MKYAILIYESAADFAAREDEADKAAYWGGHGAYVQALRADGKFVSGAALLPPHASTTVRLRGGSRQVVDGPYADTKEQLGGFCLIEAENLDAALAWAAQCPTAATGAIEVRPLLESS